ncbi:ubiquinol oxidase subunit II [Hansschlegelia quercus]|uniref:Ubiquinol oxidase subunit 2 n=1 Tax=Hansschlegelia quercus TaxID=2528245 RepID=A0A4Q9GGG5_9HYPH|nr:ubiquinol oxidase subunit II [Hansschlegelia quercus]
MASPVRALRLTALLPLLLILTGCDWVVMSPSGDVAMQQRDLIVISTALMLLIIVPVIALTLLFAWRYRSSNKDATYDPDWHHSTQLEVVIWAAPLVIIIALGAITWVSTHLLDPYRPLNRVADGRSVDQAAQPLEVQAVALDWKWLFIYPQYGIATVNELAAPVDRPISFRLTSTSVMNSFFIPALAGQIYAMPGMDTKLHAVINKAGVFNGFSANYSGAGFSDMRFKFHGVSGEEFEKWVADIKAGQGGNLDRAAYTGLAEPSVKEAPKRFQSVAPDLYDAILNRCVDPARMCMKDMMAVDAEGGMGMAGLRNVFERRVDVPGAPPATGSRFVAAVCTPQRPRDGEIKSAAATPIAFDKPLIDGAQPRSAGGMTE